MPFSIRKMLPEWLIRASFAHSQNDLDRDDSVMILTRSIISRQRRDVLRLKIRLPMLDGGWGVGIVLTKESNFRSKIHFGIRDFTLHRTVIPSYVIPLAVSSYPLYLPRNISNKKGNLKFSYNASCELL